MGTRVPWPGNCARGTFLWVTLAAVAALLALSACAVEPGETPTSRTPRTGLALAPLTPAPRVPGDPENGRRLFIDRGCGGCHTLSGLPSATGVMGPNLTNVSLRSSLANGAVPSSPENMARWIMDPPALKPGTAMPKLGLSALEAQDIAAYLYSQPYNPSP